MSESLVEKIFWLTINCYHEARGESESGKIAVCKVVLNRVNDRRWPGTVKDVIWQSSQFSWTLDSKLWDIKRTKKTMMRNEKSTSHYKALLRCAQAAMKAYLQWMVGSRYSGANHYYATYISKPKWADHMKVVGREGVHKFYVG